MKQNPFAAIQILIRRIFLPIFSGMLIAQVIGSLFVYLSNQHILEISQVIKKAGFFPIPAGKAMASLNEFGAACRGGLFFTLSIGTGLTLTVWIAYCIWDLCFKNHPKVLRLYLVLWIGVLVWINLNGFWLFPTLFCLLVPAITWGTTYYGLKNKNYLKSGLWFVPMVTLIVLTGLWATQLNNNLFIGIRDHILLSNPVGNMINDFYYRNTLYAAETFKTFDQKTLRTCTIEGLKNDEKRHQLEKQLLQHDVLVVPNLEKPDIKLVVSNTGIQLQSTQGRSLPTTTEAILTDTKSLLSEFSKLTDRYSHFRRLTFLGLLLGFPILLFVMIYAVLRIILALFMEEKGNVLVGSVLCLIIGIALFLPMLAAHPVKITLNNMNTALMTSDVWPKRVAALRYIERNNTEIANYPSYQKIVSSPFTVERYWLARALAKSKAPSTYRYLFVLLNDPHPNVVCQAFYALGKRGQLSAIGPIKRKLTNLDHWYAQWYGYRALRRLGWHQGLLKSQP